MLIFILNEMFVIDSLDAMDFNLEIKEKGPSLTEPVSFMVTEETKLAVMAIKRTSERNKKLMNELMRQCLSQLITKFKAGEFEEAG